MEQGRKKQRVAKEDRTKHYDELANIQSAQFEGDSLGSPAIRKALDHFLSTRRPTESVKEQIEKSLRFMKESLDNLPDEAVETSVNSKRTTKLLRKLAPNSSADCLFRSPNNDNMSLECKPPSRVNVVGSFLLGYSSSSSIATDLAVEMPSDLFQSKDFINFKYNDKRLLYLLYLAHHLSSTEENNWVNMSLTKLYVASNPDKPTLTLSHKSHPQIRIRLIPTIATDLFDSNRLGDDRKNIRPVGASSVVSEKSEATVAYNQSILADSKVISNLQLLHSIISSTPSFVDSVILLEAWNIRHQFKQSKFIFTVLIANLLSQSAIPQRASREHILRCAFNAIRSGSLATLRFNNVQVSAFTNNATLKRMAECARTALVIIESETAADDPWNGVVPHLFASARGTKSIPYPISSLFDGFVRFYNTDGKSLSFEEKNKLEKVMHQGLCRTRRLSQIEPLGEGLYGLTFTSYDDMVRKVDLIDKKTDPTEFKSFWGSKTSLRRFKDGKIAMSLIWCGGIRTLNEIIQHLMSQHFSSNKGLEFKVFVGELEEAARLSDSDTGTNVAISAFNELATLLRSIEGLPLRIHSLHATSPHLRRCGMYPIRPNESSRFIEPLHIVAAFESSNAWPDDVVALAASKAAFYVALRDKLMEQGVEASATISYLEIFLGNVVFWLRVKIDKENDILDGTKEGSKLAWETETMVQHHDDVRRIETSSMSQVCRLAKRWLNAQLMFRCIGERRDSVVELLVASVMCHPLMSRATSVMRGFCQFLHILSSFPWEVCPLVVSFPDDDDVTMNEAIDGDEALTDRKEDANRYEAIQQAQKHFDSSREMLGLYVAHGKEVEPWLSGSNAVERVVLRRLQMTAKAALDFIERYLGSNTVAIANQNTKLTLDTLFAADTEGFDATLKLNEQACVVKPQPLSSALYYRKGRSFLAGIDPVEHVWTDLENRLGKWALFLGRIRSGSSLHIVWRPIVQKKVRFALRDSVFCEFDDEDNLKVSKEQLIEEMKHICQGLLVEAVTVE